MPTYETLYITPPNLTEDEEDSTIEAMARIVTDGGGDLIVNERMGRRRLAYPIRKFDDGTYTRLLYDSEPAVPLELERRIRLSDNVLRSLTVRLEREWAVEAKEEAVREAQRRVEEAAAEAARLEAEELAAANAAANAEATEVTGAAEESAEPVAEAEPSTADSGDADSASPAEVDTKPADAESGAAE